MEFGSFCLLPYLVGIGKYFSSLGMYFNVILGSHLNLNNLNPNDFLDPVTT